MDLTSNLLDVFFLSHTQRLLVRRPFSRTRYFSTFMGSFAAANTITAVVCLPKNIDCIAWKFIYFYLQSEYVD